MLFLPQRIWISPIILFFLILEKLLCYIIFNLKYIIMQSDINKYSVNPKRNQSWIFTGKTFAETPILWPPDLKNWCIGKDPDSGKDWRQERRRGQRMRWVDGITEWTGAWASVGCWSWTGSHGVLRSRGSQRVGHDWVTELNWTEAVLITVNIISELLRKLKTDLLSVQWLVTSVVPNSLWSYGYSPPGSFVHGILKVRILEWVAMPSSRGFSQPSDQAWVSCIGRGVLYH